jgi:hypothetical protein
VLDLGLIVIADTVHRSWSLEGRKIERLFLGEPVPSLKIGLAWKHEGELSDVAQAFAA